MASQITIQLSFNPTQKTKQLLKALENERALDVLARRYGLSTTTSPETLESVGQSYGITRERVRQIENHAIKTIQKSDAYSAVAEELRQLATLIEESGGVIPEDELLSMLSCTTKTKNHILFLLAVGEPFYKRKENPEFVQHWYTNESHAHQIRESLRQLHKELDNQTVLPEEQIIENYTKKIGDTKIKDLHEDQVLLWLKLSKKIAKNPLGEWGLSTSPAVRVKGIRDYAYLTLKRHGSPMHFGEVAEQIEQLFGRTAHKATTHNELIKDPRFVLVGRGLYALTEWGYTQGVVKDVIKSLLNEAGPLSRDEIVERVKRERYVKDNTILVNLQDTDVFVRLDDGRYALV
jgi:hypothetical protein